MKRRLFPLTLFLALLILLGRPATAQEQTQTPTPQPSPGLPGTTPNSPFGVIESTESPKEADSLGVGWTRLIFHWADLQPGGPDDWQPEITFEELDREIAAGREVVGMLIGIPDWARDEDQLPDGLWLDYDDPANTWAQYVRQAVTYYADYIDHWLIWNEPDIPKSEIAHSWDGSVADFAQLQRVAYLAAKEANPQAVIHLSAFTYWADYYAGTEQYIDRLLDELLADPDAAENNLYFDIASAHLYFQPDQIYELLGLFIDALRSRGLDHPIWLVETNAPPVDDPDWPVRDWTLSVTTREQAAFMPQALASAFAAGAERVAVYKLQDTEEDRAANPEPFGLLRLDGSRRPAFDTYRIAIKQLGGAFHVERERWDEVGSIRFDQSGQTTTVLYSRLPQPQRAEIQATAGEALLTDMFGTSQVITSTNGIYTVNLPAARCSQSIGDYCMIGGFTYYLIQAADIHPPTPTPQSSPTPGPGEQSSPQLETPAESAQPSRGPGEQSSPQLETPAESAQPSRGPGEQSSPQLETPAESPQPVSSRTPTALLPTATAEETSTPKQITAATTSTPSIQSPTPSPQAPATDDQLPITDNQLPTPNPQPSATTGERSSPKLETRSPANLLYGIIAPLSIAAIIVIYAIIRRRRR